LKASNDCERTHDHQHRQLRRHHRERVDALAWDELRTRLDRRGFAISEPLLDADECRELAHLFEGGQFRSTIDMARHRFGDGRYRYFDHPLPDTIVTLRSAFYAHLAPIANDWSQLLRCDHATFPLEHEELLERCRAAGQERPTPLILRYGEGDWNALHQDLYGDVFFPFQVLTVLSNPGVDFDGGEFVLMEQRPRAQSRAHVLRPRQGAFVISHPPPAQRRPQRVPQGRATSRREHPDSRPADRARRHLSRRPLISQIDHLSPRAARLRDPSAAGVGVAPDDTDLTRARKSGQPANERSLQAASRAPDAGNPVQPTHDLTLTTEARWQRRTVL